MNAKLILKSFFYSYLFSFSIFACETDEASQETISMADLSALLSAYGIEASPQEIMSGAVKTKLQENNLKYAEITNQRLEQIANVENNQLSLITNTIESQKRNGSIIRNFYDQLIILSEEDETTANSVAEAMNKLGTAAFERLILETIEHPFELRLQLILDKAKNALPISLPSSADASSHSDSED